MRTLLLCAALAAACDPAGRPASHTPPITTGIYPDASTGDPAVDDPRLDLGAVQPIPDLPAEDTTGAGGETTGEIAETGSSSSSETSAAGGETTSTGEADSSSSSGGESSTGEPPALVCGDGVCDPAERAPCWAWEAGKWAPGFCPEDCMSDPACVAELDCECTAEAAAVKSWCFADPLPACAATAPGGACEVSAALAFYQWNAKCG